MKCFIPLLFCLPLCCFYPQLKFCFFLGINISHKNNHITNNIVLLCVFFLFISLLPLHTFTLFLLPFCALLSKGRPLLLTYTFFSLPGCHLKSSITFHVTFVTRRSSFVSCPHSCLLSFLACLSLASKEDLVSISSSSCRRIRAMSSWVASHCSLRAADSTLSWVVAMESFSLRSRHCICILLASLSRDSTLTTTDSHWSRDMFWTETEKDGGQTLKQILGSGQDAVGTFKQTDAILVQWLCGTGIWDLSTLFSIVFTLTDLAAK